MNMLYEITVSHDRECGDGRLGAHIVRSCACYWHILLWDTDNHILVYTCLQPPRLQSKRRGVPQPNNVESRVEVTLFLGALANLRKASISFGITVRLSVRMVHLGSH